MIQSMFSYVVTHLGNTSLCDKKPTETRWLSPQRVRNSSYAQRLLAQLVYRQGLALWGWYPASLLIHICIHLCRILVVNRWLVREL